MPIDPTTDIFAVLRIDYSSTEALSIVGASSAPVNLLSEGMRQNMKEDLTDTLEVLEREMKASCESWTPTQSQFSNTRFRSEMISKLSTFFPGMRIAFVSVVSDKETAHKLVGALRRKWETAETTGHSVLCFTDAAMLTGEEQTTVESNLLLEYDPAKVMEFGLSEGGSMSTS